MKPLLLLFIALTFFGLRVAFAQTTNANPVDDDFNVGLLVGVIIVFSVMTGAMIIGFIATTMILIFLFGLVSAGIFSTAIMVGLYKRSVSAGFRTLIVIVSAIGGIMLGIGGLYLIDTLFQLHLSPSIITWSGLGGGLAGGILLGLCLYAIIRLFLDYTRKKLSL